MKHTGNPIGSNHRIIKRPDGREVVVEDRGARLAKLPVNKRIAARNSKRQRYVKGSGKQRLLNL